MKNAKNVEKEEKRKIPEAVCTKIIFAIATAIFFVFCFWALKYKHTYGLDFTSEHVIAVYDSLKKNAVVLLVVMLSLYAVQALLLRGDIEKQKKKVFIFLIADLIVTGILATIWVSGCHIMPKDDQYQVYLTAVQFMQGNFADMKAYFYMCPQQYGLAFIYECILWIWESYHFVQYINVAFLLVILFFGYKISDCLFENPRINLYTVLVMNGFLPLFFYVNFVYGEMGAVATSLCGIWGVLKWMQTQKKRYAISAIMAMIFAFLVRMNMVIISIALIIVLLFFVFYKKNWRALILAVALIAVPMMCIEMVEYSYEVRSGNEVGDGIPVVLNVAMGMQESWEGAGAYNAYNHITFAEVNGDSHLAAEAGKAYIKGRLEEFKANPEEARNFYQRKIWEQWNVGCFGSLLMTKTFEGAPFAPAQATYDGVATPKLMDWMEYYIFVVYFGAFIYCLYGILFEKDVKKTILPMVVIGGLIFSLLWEAKARYVFPYVAILLPSVATGIHMFHLAVEKTIKAWVGKVRSRNGK